MKVLLIVPTHSYLHYPVFLSVSDFPSGFAYLASALKQVGHEVIGLNLNNILGYASGYDMIKTEIRKVIRKLQPDLIGTGGLCIDYHFLKDAIAIIREETKAPIVLGGGIVNNDAVFIFNHLKPDYCVIGEGEETLVKLVDCLQTKGDLIKIPNIGYWEEKE